MDGKDDKKIWYLIFNTKTMQDFENLSIEQLDAIAEYIRIVNQDNYNQKEIKFLNKVNEHLRNKDIE